MATIEYASADNWLELSSLIDDYFTHYNNYIFRGQADTEWKLESTLTRTTRTFYPNAADHNVVKAAHLACFKENIRGRCNLDLEAAKEEELWALGQHFGLHTPLLDWTRSPYVAVFFSLFGDCKSGSRALWAFLEEDVAGINASIQDENNKIKVIRPLTHHNQRLVSQNGLFIEAPVGKCIEEMIRVAPEFEWVTMYKIAYPDNIRDEVLSALNNMNINHTSLFPDLIGSSFYTNFRLEIEPYLDKERSKLWE